MSLDVYLVNKQKITRKKDSGIFVRKDGRTVEISEAEWYKRNPGHEPVRVEQSDDETHEVFEWDITHNLGLMAKNAHIYYALWRPDERGWKLAKDIIKPLEKGLKKLKARPDYFKQFNPENGWGSYEGLVEFVENYLEACIAYPDAVIEVSR